MHCFDKLLLDAGSCQTTDTTESVCALIESELKDLKSIYYQISTKIYRMCSAHQNA